MQKFDVFVVFMGPPVRRPARAGGRRSRLADVVINIFNKGSKREIEPGIHGVLAKTVVRRRRRRMPTRRGARPRGRPVAARL